MLRPRQFSLWQVFVTITGIAAYIGLVRYLLLSGHGETTLTWLTAGLAVFIGGIMTAMGCWSIFHAIRQILFWRKASAVVVRYCIKRSESLPTGQPFYHPVLRFEADDGRTITTISSWGSWRRPWGAGTTVMVRYNPADPEWVEIASLANIWGMPFTFLALSLGIALMLWFS